MQDLPRVLEDMEFAHRPAGPGGTGTPNPCSLQRRAASLQQTEKEP